MKALLTILATLLTSTAFAIEPVTMYFSCNVKETIEGKKIDVNVKFAVDKLDVQKKTGELLAYPGAVENEDTGMLDSILVTPTRVENDMLTSMSNLNAQGGDFSFREDGSVMLWGDGDGYQYTELVIWDVENAVYNAEENQELFKLEGYVRDFGPAYMGKINLKQFIKCDMSTKAL